VDNLLKYIKRLGKQGRIHNPHLLGGDSGSVTPGRRSMHSMANVAFSALRMKRKSSVSGIIRRTCSIQVEAGDMPGMSCCCNCDSLMKCVSFSSVEDLNDVESSAYIRTMCTRYSVYIRQVTFHDGIVLY